MEPLSSAPRRPRSLCLSLAPHEEGAFRGGSEAFDASRRMGVACRQVGGAAGHGGRGTQPSSPYSQLHNSVLPEMISQPPSLWNLLECSRLSSGDSSGLRWGH